MSAWRDRCVADGEDEPRPKTPHSGTSGNISGATFTISAGSAGSAVYVGHATTGQCAVTFTRQKPTP